MIYMRKIVFESNTKILKITVQLEQKDNKSNEGKQRDMIIFLRNKTIYNGFIFAGPIRIFA